jgi:hypothetical protein
MVDCHAIISSGGKSGEKVKAMDALRMVDLPPARVGKFSCGLAALTSYVGGDPGIPGLYSSTQTPEISNLLYLGGALMTQQQQMERPMRGQKARVDAGTVCFEVQYRTLDGGTRAQPDQGVAITVRGPVEGTEEELLRFDCFNNGPHYHYRNSKPPMNERHYLDTAVDGNPVGWTMKQLRTKLTTMLRHAGHEGLASKLDAELQGGLGQIGMKQKLDEVEAIAREKVAKEKSNARHNRGTTVIEAGNIKFGLEMRQQASGDGGIAIHLLSDVADQEIELIAFDCFRGAPHYHYGSRNNNERIFWDKTMVPDPLQWCLDQFKAGKLPAMIRRAGYPSIAEAVDADLVAATLPKVDTAAKAMVAAAR